MKPLSDKEMQQARQLWKLTYGDAPVECLLGMMAEAMLRLEDEKLAEKGLRVFADLDIPMDIDRLRAMAELTIAFVRETLEARGYELEVTMAPNNETLQ
jgi:hypothetical protein